MGTAGYNTVIKRSGTSTAFNGETMSATAVTNQYQIDDTTKEVWDRSTTPTFYEDSVEIPSSDIESIDYVFGKVTFATSKTGSITVDGDYFPTNVIAQANNYSIDQSIDLQDNTDYETAQSNGGYRTYQGILYDVSVSVGRYDDLNNLFHDDWDTQSPVVVEIQPGGGTNDIFRAYCLIESANKSGDVESLEEQDISFQIDDTGDGSAWGWRDY